MLNENSFQAVQQATFDQIFCRPLYESYCFAHLPATFKRLFTGQAGGLPSDVLLDPQQRYDRVVVLFIDGFGWRFLSKYLEELPFLQRFLKQGKVSLLTSQFPSTTVAHLTCLHTGLPVGQHGLYEWFYYEPLLNGIFAPFRYCLAGDQSSEPLQQLGIQAEQLFPFRTVYQELHTLGIPSTLYYHRSYASSPYSQLVGKGATIIPYASCAEAIYLCAERLKRESKGYFYLYLAEVDTASHTYGPDAPEVDRVIRTYFDLLEKRLGNHPFLDDPKTALILTADHGEASTPASRTLYVNQLCAEIIPWMKTDFRGYPLAPAGSPRDYFLYIQETRLEEAYQALTAKFAGKAKIYRTQSLMEQGIFGPLPLSSRFLERMGNLVILPLENESVFWYESQRFEQLCQGNHGGLSREEMETIFLIQAGG